MSTVTCIVIEDDPAFQTIIKSLISKLPNFEILDIFDNSVDAALSITKRKPDVVFMDVEINGLNGLEVIDTLDHRPKTIIITGEKKYEDEASELEVDAFITKPISSFESFREVVEKVVNS